MEYGIIARNMLSGAGYSFSWFHSDGSFVVLPTAYMPPGQVLIQYFFLCLFGDTHVSMIGLYLFQIVQAGAFIYIVGKITDLLFKSEKATQATIWLAAIYPPFIYVTMTFGVTSSALLVNALVLYLGICFSQALSTGKKAVAFASAFGAACGILLLFRGEAPVIIFSTLVLLACVHRGHLRRTFLHIGLAGCMATAILAPWVIRNYLVFDRFIPTSTNGGFNFWRGNNAVTSGSPWSETGAPVWSTDTIYGELEPHMKQGEDFEKINSEIHIREAMHWIEENPKEFAILSLKKAFIFWTVDSKSKMAGTILYITIYGLTLLLLIPGIFFIRRNKVSVGNADARIGFRIMILWCSVMTLTAMIFFPLPRFQVLLIGIYFPVMGYALSQLTQLYLGKWKSQKTL